MPMLLNILDRIPRIWHLLKDTITGEFLLSYNLKLPAMKILLFSAMTVIVLIFVVAGLEYHDIKLIFVGLAAMIITMFTVLLNSGKHDQPRSRFRRNSTPQPREQHWDDFNGN
jgi:hypothetical protein